MSAKVSRYRSRSCARSRVTRANSRISFGSERSRLCARWDISRWCCTRNTTRSTRSGESPSRSRAAPRAHGALLGVVPAEALADVVEQAAEEERDAVVAAAHQLGQLGDRLLVLPLPEPAQLLDQEDRVNVHGVGVVHHVLPATDDVRPFRQVGRQQPHLVHRHQRAHHAALGAEDAQEDLRGLGAGAEVVVDQVEVLAHQAARLARERHVVLLRHREGPQQAQRTLAQHARVRNLELAVGDPEAVLDVADLAPPRLAPQARLALLDHQRRAALHHAGVAVVVAHEALDRAARRRPGCSPRSPATPRSAPGARSSSGRSCGRRAGGAGCARARGNRAPPRTRRAPPP